MSFLDRLREKTDLEKTKIAKKIAGLFAGFLVIIWGFVFLADISKYETKSVNSLVVVGKQVANVYLSFKSNISEVSGSIKKIFFNISKREEVNLENSATVEVEVSNDEYLDNQEGLVEDTEININKTEETK